MIDSTFHAGSYALRLRRVMRSARFACLALVAQRGCMCMSSAASRGCGRGLRRSGVVPGTRNRRKAQLSLRTPRAVVDTRPLFASLARLHTPQCSDTKRSVCSLPLKPRSFLSKINSMCMGRFHLLSTESSEMFLFAH